MDSKSGVRFPDNEGDRHMSPRAHERSQGREELKKKKNPPQPEIGVGQVRLSCLLILHSHLCLHLAGI